MSKSTHRIFNLSIIASSTYIVRNTINEEIKKDAKLLGACHKSGTLGAVVKETDCGTLILFFFFRVRQARVCPRDIFDKGMSPTILTSSFRQFSKFIRLNPICVLAIQDTWSTLSHGVSRTTLLLSSAGSLELSFTSRSVLKSLVDVPVKRESVKAISPSGTVNFLASLSYSFR